MFNIHFEPDFGAIYVYTLHAVWSYKERSLHQTTEANKLLKTDAKTVLYRTILRVYIALPREK